MNLTGNPVTGFLGDLEVVPRASPAPVTGPAPGEEGPFPSRSGYTIAGVARVG